MCERNSMAPTDRNHFAGEVRSEARLPSVPTSAFAHSRESYHGVPGSFSSALDPHGAIGCG